MAAAAAAGSGFALDRSRAARKLPAGNSGGIKRVETHEIAERIHEEHHAHWEQPHDPLRRFTGIYLGVLAMVLAIAALGGGHATKEMLNANIHASDTYAYYQAKYLRQIDYQIAADQLEILISGQNPLPPDVQAKASALIKKYRETAARYESEPETGDGKKELVAKARAWEERRERAAERNPNFEYADALLQIAVVLGSVSIVASSRALLMLSAALAGCGVLLLVNGLLLLVPLPAG
jgi:hypothetical protein